MRGTFTWSLGVAFVLGAGALFAPGEFEDWSPPNPPLTIPSVCAGFDLNMQAKATEYYNHFGPDFDVAWIPYLNMGSDIELGDALFNTSTDGSLNDTSDMGRLNANKQLVKGVNVSDEPDSLYKNIADLTRMVDADAPFLSPLDAKALGEPSLNTTDAVETVAQMLDDTVISNRGLRQIVEDIQVNVQDVGEGGIASLTSLKVRVDSTKDVIQKNGEGGATSETSIYGRANDTLSQIQKNGEGNAVAGDSLYARTQSAQDVIQKDGEGNATEESSIYGRADATLSQIQKNGEGNAVAGDSLYARTKGAQVVIQKDGEGNATGESSIYGRADATLSQIQKDGEGGAEAGDSLYARTGSVTSILVADGQGDVQSTDSLYRRAERLRAKIQPDDADGADPNDSAYERVVRVMGILVDPDDEVESGQDRNTLHGCARICQQRICADAGAGSANNRVDMVNDLIGDVKNADFSDILNYEPPVKFIGNDIHSYLQEAMRVLNIVLNPNKRGPHNVASPVVYTVQNLNAKATLVDIIQNIRPLGS